MKHFAAWRSRSAGVLALATVLAVGGSLVLPHAFAAGGQAFISYACTGGASDAGTVTSDLSSLGQGGTLLLAGTCDVGSLTVPADVTLEGTESSDSGVGTQLNGNLTETSGESTTIQDLQVNCGGSGTGIELEGWQDTVTHVTVDECYYGIELYSSSGTGNHVNDRITDDFIEHTDSGGYGFYVDDAGNGVTDGYFTGNYVQGGATSIYMTNAAGWYIEDNHTYDQSGVAIYANDMWGTKIAGNYIESWSGYGIEGTVQSGAVGSVVADNNVFQNDLGTVGSGGSPGVGIYLTPNASSDCFAAVTGNNVISTSTDSGSYGIEGSGAGLTFTSSGNNVQGAGTASAATNGAVKTSGV